MLTSTDVPDRVVERALTRFHVDDNGCWISDYSVGGHGYAQVGYQEDGYRTMILVHRLVWVVFFGDIPDDWTVDHRCRVYRCMRPDHLRLLENYENARRTQGRDWPLGSCINGHSNDLLVRESSGRLRCPLCKLEHQRAYRERKRAGV